MSTNTLKLEDLVLIVFDRLNNDDVNKDQARKMACVSAKVFDKVLTTVMKALENAPQAQSSPRKSSVVSYTKLCRSNSVKQSVIPWAEKTAKVLSSLDSRWQHESVETICAVFCWVCSNVKV